MLYGLLKLLAKIGLPLVFGLAVCFNFDKKTAKNQYYQNLQASSMKKGLLMAINWCSIILIISGLGAANLVAKLPMFPGLSALLKSEHCTFGAYWDYHGGFSRVFFLVVNIAWLIAAIIAGGTILTKSEEQVPEYQEINVNKHGNLRFIWAATFTLVNLGVGYIGYCINGNNPYVYFIIGLLFEVVLYILMEKKGMGFFALSYEHPAIAMALRVIIIALAIILVRVTSSAPGLIRKADGIDYVFARIEKAEIGDTIDLGTHTWGHIIGNKTTDMEWIVLDRDDEKVILLSKYGMKSCTYDENKQWLTKFFSTHGFNEDMTNMLLPNEKGEKVFNLTIDEAEHYSETLPIVGECMPYVYDNALHDTLFYKASSKDYWLVDPAGKKKYPYMMSNGEIDYSGLGKNKYARPVIWVSVEALSE